MSAGAVDGAKIALRDQLLTSRRRRSLLEVGEAARAIAEHVLALP
jgi:5-formyltetrahydrofolate cyclo-ligase